MYIENLILGKNLHFLNPAIKINTYIAFTWKRFLLKGTLYLTHIMDSKSISTTWCLVLRNLVQYSLKIQREKQCNTAANRGCLLVLSAGLSTIKRQCVNWMPIFSCSVNSCVCVCVCVVFQVKFQAAEGYLILWICWFFYDSWEISQFFSGAMIDDDLVIIRNAGNVFIHVCLLVFKRIFFIIFNTISEC